MNAATLQRLKKLQARDLVSARHTDVTIGQLTLRCSRPRKTCVPVAGLEAAAAGDGAVRDRSH